MDCDGDGDEEVAALISVLDSRYTLIYRGITTRCKVTLSSGGSSDNGNLRGTDGSSHHVVNVSGRGGGGARNCSGSGSAIGGYDSDRERISPAGVLLEGLELWLVEDSGRKCSLQTDRCEDKDDDGNGRPMTKWLLEHATAILVDALPCPHPAVTELRCTIP